MRLCSHQFRLLLLVVPLAVLTGCSGDKEEPAPSPAPVAKPKAKHKPPPTKPDKPDKKATPKKPDKPLKASMLFKLDGEPIESKLCVATLNLGVLQVRNYATGKSPTYPEILLWSKTGADSFQALAGSTTDAQVFVQKSADSLPLHVSDGATVKLKISKADDTMIVGEVIDGKIFDIEARREVPFTCQFVAEMK